MAKKSIERIRTECPNCHGTQFQGPFNRGHFEGETFVIDETVYQCRTCHTEVTDVTKLNIVPLIESETA